MRIRGHPDLLILPSAGHSVARKRGMGLKPEVQGLWEVNRGYCQSLMSEVPHAGENHSQTETVGGFDDLLVAH